MFAKQLGAYVITLGICSILLSLVGLHFKYLWFLDEMGPIVGYGLRIALIGLGVLIWRRADITTEDIDPERPPTSNKAWIHVGLACGLVLGLLVFAIVRAVGDNHADQLLSRPVPPAAWASRPTKDWPPLVLLQEAHFKHHSPMAAGCASVIRLPSGDVVALTAGHLLGRPGGVQPGFLRGALSLDPQKLATLDAEISSWKLFLPDQQDQKSLRAVGLFGPANQFDEDCDQVLLRLSGPATAFPVKPLDIRLKPVVSGERVRVIKYELTDGALRQVILPARRIPGLGFTCQLEEPAELDGCSGAPVIDEDGLLVAIVTGGGLMDALSQTSIVRIFSGHAITELTPVLKAAIKNKPVSAKPG